MKVKIKRIDKSLPLPEYQTAGACAFDLYAREDTEVQSKEVKLIPSNLIIEAPPGHALILAPRSSSPKTGLSFPHSIGIIDNDYCGPEDEIKIQVYNFTDNPVKVERGQRIAQGMFVRIDRGEWQETEEMNNKTRGGFGTTS